MSNQKKIDKNVDYWLAELKRAEARRQNICDRNRWKELTDVLDGGDMEVTLSSETETTATAYNHNSSYVNWPYAFSMLFVPSVYSEQPKINVTPEKAANEAGAKVIEPMLNDLISFVKFKREGRYVLRDCLKWGAGWVKLGWFTYLRESVPAAPADPALGGTTSKLLPEIDFIENAPYARRISIWDLLFDPDAVKYEELRWVAHQYWQPYDLVMKDPSFKYKKEIQSQSMDNDENRETHSYDANREEDIQKRGWTKITEIWDWEDKKVRFLCSGSKHFNREIDTWPYSDVNGFPFKQYTPEDSPDTIYPPSIILPWLSICDELAEIRALRMEHIEKQVTKFIVDGTRMSPEAIEALKDKEQDIIVSKGIDNVIQELRGLQPDANLYAAEDKLEQDIQNISGLQDILRGGLPFSRVGATVGSIMEQNANIRMNHYSERYKDFILDCAETLFYIAREYQQDPREVTSFVGSEPKPIEFTARDIEGSYKFDFDVEDMSVNRRQQKIKEAYDLLVAAAQFPESNNHKLLRNLFVSAGVSNPDEFLYPEQGPPLSPRQENDLLMKGVPVPVNIQDDDIFHLQVHDAFMKSPGFQQALQRYPDMQHLFQEHVQLQSYQREQKMRMMANQQKTPQAGVSPSIQAGQANATSQPAGGPTNKPPGA